MGVVAVAADKGSPGVTTAALAIAAVWPRPVLLAECDAAGGDLLYRLPAADGGRLDPQRGLLSLAIASRRGIQPHQVWRHTQKLHGGLDILTGLVNAEQAGGLQLLWGQIGKLLAEVPEVDVIADCGRLGPDGPFYDLLAHACAVVLIARVTLEDVVRLRDRVIALARGLANRRLVGPPIGVVVVADHKHFKRNIAEVSRALAASGAPARMLGGLAEEPKSAHMIRGQWGTRLDRSLLIRTARELAGRLARELPMLAGQVAAGSGNHLPESSPAERAAGLPSPEPERSWPLPPPPAQVTPAKAVPAQAGLGSAVPAVPIRAASAQAGPAQAGSAQSHASDAKPPPAEAVPQPDPAPFRPAVPSRTPVGPAGGAARPEPASSDPAVQAPAPSRAQPPATAQRPSRAQPPSQGQPPSRAQPPSQGQPPSRAQPSAPGPRLQPVPGPAADAGTEQPTRVAGNGAPHTVSAQRKDSPKGNDSPNGQRPRAGR